MLRANSLSPGGLNEHVENYLLYFIKKNDVLEKLINYTWAGNVRELENCMERAVIVAAGRQITEQDLPEAIRAQFSDTANNSQIEISFPASMEDVERKMIEQTLLFAEGDKAKASRILGIGRKTLYRKLEQYKKEQTLSQK